MNISKKEFFYYQNDTKYKNYASNSPFIKFKDFLNEKSGIYTSREIKKFTKIDNHFDHH